MEELKEPSPEELKKTILDEAAVPGRPTVFQIGFGTKQVSLYAQQARALRLVWALHQENKLASAVIVGGGVAGTTAAAAGMLLGAAVTLLEQNDELLHLQRGCHTRYLHPRIFDWPRSDARRRPHPSPAPAPGSSGISARIAPESVPGSLRI